MFNVMHTVFVTVLIVFHIPQTCFSQIVTPSVPPVIVQEGAAQAEAENQTPCAVACAKLASHIPTKLFLGKDGNFDYWDAKQWEIHPACRIEPETPEDVASVLSTAVETGCHFAVKSGGHARDAHFSNAAGGITIDLVRMGWVELSKDKKSVKVGAGARWVDVYRKLEENALTVIGGRVADVGVGGLTLGGGISFFSNRHGWACDSTTAFDIVFADSKIATITQKSNPDVYRALRGAGQQNFGIVTGFTYETHKLPNPKGVWDSARVYAWEKKPDLMKEHLKYYLDSDTKDKDTGGFNVFIYMADYDTWAVFDRYVHTTHKDNQTTPSIFEPLMSIEAVPDTTKTVITPVSDITLEIKDQNPYGFRQLYGTFCFQPSLDLDTAVIDIFREEIERVKDGVKGFVPACVYHLLSKTAISKMQKHGGSALSLNLKPEDGPLIIVNIAWRWSDAEDDAKVNSAFQAFMRRSEAKAKEDKAWHPFKYPNYADWTQDIKEGFGEKGLAWLREVQRKADPRGVFTKGGLLRGGFVLNESPPPKNGETTEIKDEL